MDLNKLLQNYQPIDKEKKYLILSHHLLKIEARCFWLDCFFPGHFTGSAWITNPSFTKILLIMHPTLNRWTQPGGHADGDKNLLSVALRESEEELGFNQSQFKSSPEIFDLDIHVIKERIKNDKLEPEHLHYDVRFHIVIDDTQKLPLSPENIEFRWFTLAESEPLFAESQGRSRMLQKTIALAKR